MICKVPECGTEMGSGEPYAATLYYCPTCCMEHVVNAREITDMLVQLQNRIDELERLNAVAPLPSLL